MSMEKVRELSSLLLIGISDYDDNLKLLQQERLKFLRLSMSNGFTDDSNNSKESWINHLRQLESSLNVRLKSIQAFIKESARQIGEAEAEDVPLQR